MATEPKITGIYKIVNTINGHKYVGSGMSIKGRWRTHLHYLRQNKHHSPYLQRAWNKYGEESFEFIIIEECEPTKEVLLDREQFWIDELHAYGETGYNGTPKAANSLGHKHTAESREKISKSNKGVPRMSDEMKEFHRKQMTGNKFRVGNTTRKGVKCTPEQVEKNRIGHTGLKQSPETIEKRMVQLRGRKMSDEVKANMSESHMGKKLSPESIEKRTATQKARRDTILNDVADAIFRLVICFATVCPLCKVVKRLGGKIIPHGTKFCTLCKSLKDIGEFSKAAKSPDGLYHSCKQCQKNKQMSIVVITDENNSASPKMCIRCNTLKTEGDFYKCIRRYDGLSAYCKTCKYEIDKEYRDRKK